MQEEMFTTTRTMATSWSKANVRYVMDKVYEDIRQHVSARLLSEERAKRWCEDLTYLLDMQAISEFQIQYHHHDGRTGGLGYRVNDAGQLFINDSSGGLDLYGIGRPSVNLVIKYRTDCRDLDTVQAYLRGRGWTSHGQLLSGGTHDHTYSRNGYGLERLRFGVGCPCWTGCTYVRRSSCSPAKWAVARPPWHLRWLRRLA